MDFYLTTSASTFPRFQMISDLKASLPRPIFSTIFFLLIDVNEWINKKCSDCMFPHQNIRNCFTRSHLSKGENSTEVCSEIYVTVNNISLRLLRTYRKNQFASSLRVLSQCLKVYSNEMQALAASLQVGCARIKKESLLLHSVTPA